MARFIARCARIIALSTMTLLASAVALAEAQRADQALVIADTGTTIELSVPASEFWLVIPKQGFTVLAPKASGQPGPRYFELVNREQGIEISGWLEAAEVFTSLRQVWDHQVEDWKNEEAPLPKEISFGAEGGWQTIQYQTTREGVTRHHLRAAQVYREVWLDVNVAIQADSETGAPEQEMLKLLQSMSTRRY